MFRSFVLFIAAQAVTFSHNFKFLNVDVTIYFYRYLLLSRATQSFVIIDLFACYIAFPIF